MTTSNTFTGVNDMERETKQRKVELGRALANTRGMTIVELMIVLTIIASIMGVVGFFAFGAINNAGIKEAQIEIKQLSNMVETYYLASSPRSLPSNLDDLAEGSNKLTEKVPKDPWGNDYIYTKTGNREFEIHSAGPDGIEGNEDDVFEEGKGAE